jgi:predicted Fe-Mo cluster-binding NifX family protein
MKVCISSTERDLNSDVDPRFGRCIYFIIVDTNTQEFKAIANSNISATGGAGIQSAQLVAKEGVEAVITGNMGPNAFQTLFSLKIKVFTGAAGTVKDAIKEFKNGKLQEMLK